MKKVLIISILTIVFFSCKKGGKNEQPNYAGVYTSTTKDTVKVTKNGNYLKFVFTNLETVHTPVPAPTTPTNIGEVQYQFIKTFDSVRVASDLTFTDNESYTNYIFTTGSVYPLPASNSVVGTSTGTGSFGTNTISIKFDALVFNGVKL